jgi:formyl-CoA transferase
MVALIDDPRFATEAERRTRSSELASIMAETFATKPYEHWREALAAKEVTFGVISRPSDVPDDEQAVACGAVVDTAIAGMPRTLANPIRLSFAEQRTAQAAPALGEHSEAILREAGMSAPDVAALKQSGGIK